MRLKIGTALAAAFVAVLILVASAAGATTYRVAGIETTATSSSASFQGVLFDQPGTWTAMILHGDLAKSPGAITQIHPGGAFSFSTPPGGGTSGSTMWEIAGGQLIAQPALGGTLCIQRFLVSGTLGTATGGIGGSFQGTLTHFGMREQGVCNAFFATFIGSVTTP